MPKENSKEQKRIERIMLLFYFLYSIAMTVVTIESGISDWVIFVTDAGFVFCFILYWAKIRTYEFRSYASICMLQISAMVWSVCIGSLSMTAPLLALFAVSFVIYGLPEVVYITVVVSTFLNIYHLMIMQTVDMSSSHAVIQTVLEIAAVYYIEYVVGILIKSRINGMGRLSQIIMSLKAAERSKDDFMANISHEIRTPINTICGMSEIVLREQLEDQVRADVFNIQTAGRNLLSIVSDVLDFTEMQSGKMTLAEETYNITSTINDVINMSMARKNEKEIDLVVDCDADIPSSLFGDEQKIRRIIMNLVNNALKFTVEGCVSIAIGARHTDYGINLIVNIKDTGIGMKKESLEKLFTNFNQVDTKRNRQEDGIGLGLAISQAMVDMMGGFITVSSEFGKGTEVQFVIPQKVIDQKPIAAVHSPEQLNVAIYVDMERYDRPEVREAYGRVIMHMVMQLKVKSHICQNLAELKRRTKREKFTHIFISIEEYEEDQEYFDHLSETSKLVMILERSNDMKITNSNIRKLYKPFFILPVVMALNDEKIQQGLDIGYHRQGKFTAPDTSALIVDDNLMNIRVLEGLLRPYKIKVSMATSGPEALEKIESMSYDVVFMDHMMPEMDGIETLQRIRQKQGNYFKKLPVIAVTANAVGGMREVFLQEGFQDFVAKPIEVSVLDRVLRRTLPQEKLIRITQEEEDASVSDQKDAGNTVRKENETAPQQTSSDSRKEEERQTDLPPDSFDERTGIRYCGTLEDYIEVLRLASRSGARDGDRLQQFYEKQDWKNYATLVHAVKSTMISIGVEKLSDMAKQLELASKHDDVAYVLENHEPMMQEYERILALLKESRTVNPRAQQEGLSGAEELEEAELDKIALEFEDAAFAFDQTEMAAIAERLAGCCFRGCSLRESMQPVMKKIEMSDYLSASEDIFRLKEMIGEGHA